MTILYFTATGNSLSVAKAVGGTLKSIPQLIENNEYMIEDDAIGIIVPCFGFSIPRIVSRYLGQATLKADYIFAGVTSASMPGNAVGEINRLLKKNGAYLDYAMDIFMMNNYLVWSAMEDELELLKEKNVDEQILKFVNDINGRIRYLPKKSLVNKLCTYFADYSRFSHSDKKTSNFDKNFTIDNNCIGCGICEKVCPIHNISVDKIPTFSHKCEACLACIHNCPKTAIHYVKEKSTGRYRNDKVSLKEIIESNQRS